MTAGPARVISASAAKLAIRWKSSPMKRKQLKGMMPCVDLTLIRLHFEFLLTLEELELPRYPLLLEKMQVT